MRRSGEIVEDHERDLGDHIGFGVSIVSATAVEAKAARRALPGVAVIEGGIALAKIGPALQAQGDTKDASAAIISCGVAGGLRPDLPTGTVVIPRDVLRPDGTTLHCDEILVERLIRGARAIGIEPVSQPMATTLTLVTKEERTALAVRGYVAADMETGLLTASRVAAVRVVLDMPQRELSKDWAHPATAILRPWNWPQLFWLAREAPRCSKLAAQVIASALAG
jgi:hypothetical protein